MRRNRREIRKRRARSRRVVGVGIGKGRERNEGESESRRRRIIIEEREREIVDRKERKGGRTVELKRRVTTTRRSGEREWRG